MSLQKLNHTYQLKRGKEDTLFEKNPLLARGEPIVIYFNDGTTGLKIGDGINAYNDLPLISGKASEIDFSQIEYLTFNEYTQLTSLEEKILYVCTDTQQIFVGTNELTKSSYILEEIPTDETIGNNGSLYYCTKDLSLYLCNKVEDSYIWTIVASMDANGLKITETGKDDVAITINLDSINDSVKLKNINIKNANIEGNNIDKLGCIYTTNKNLYGGDFTTLPILSQLVPEFILDTMQFFNNELKINHQKVIEYLENNTDVEQEIIYDEELGMYKYLLMSIKIPENPADGELIVADMKMFITEDCRLKVEGFMFSEEPEDIETILESDFTIPVYVFGTPPVEVGMPATDGDNDTFRLYFTDMYKMIPAINFGLDFTFNGENVNDCTSYYQMKRLFDIDNSSDDKVIDIRLNDSSYLLTFDMVKQEVIKLKSEYEKLVEAGIQDIDESLKNTYKITYGDFKANYYIIALIVKGDLIYGNKPENEPEEFERTSNVVLNGSKLFLEKLPYETVTEILKINGTDLSDDEKSAIIIDKTGRVTAAEGFQVPSEYLSGFELTYKYKKNYTNSFATHNYAIQIDDDEFITECNKLYASEICKQLLPEALTEDNEFIEDMLVNDEITLQASGEGNNYILLSNIESEYEAKVSLTNKLNNSSSTSKVSVKEELDKIIKLTGTVNLENIFEPGTYLIEADNILGAPDNYVNNLISNKKEFINANTGEIKSADVVVSAFMKVTEYPLDIGSGVYSLEEADDGKIYVRHINTTTLELPLHTYKLNRVVCREADNPSNMIYDPEDRWNLGFFGKWIHDDDTKYGPNLLLDKNKYIKQLNMVEDAVITSDDITLDMMIFNPSNTSIVKFDMLEKMLDKCTKEFNYFPSVQHCQYSDNNIYLPIDSNSLIEYWQSHTISDKKADRQHPVNLAFLNDDIGQKFCVFRELNDKPGLYSTIDCKRFHRILDFDINREVKFSKILIDNSDSDIREIINSDYYKTLYNFVFNRLIVEGNIKYIGINDYDSYNEVVNVEYLIPEDSSHMLFYLKNNKLEIIPELDLDRGMLISAPHYYYSNDLGRYVSEYVPLGIGYNDEGKVELIDLINNKSTILFQFDTSRYNKVTFIPERLGHFKLICSNLSNNDLVTSDFTETTFTFNTQKVLDIIGAGNYSYKKIDVSKFSTPYNPDSSIDEFLINKVTLTLNDFKDLTDGHKTILLNHSSESDTRYLSSINPSTKFLDIPYRYPGYGATYGSRIICLQDKDVTSRGNAPQKLAYIFRDFVIIKDEYGNYLESITVEQPILNIYQNNFTLTCFNNTSSPPTRVLQYVSTGTKRYETINGESVLIYPHTIDTNVVTQDFLIEDQIFNKDYNNSYCKYLLDYKEPEGERVQFNGIMGTKNSPLYVPTTNINNITKFVLTPNELCRDKDNNVIAKPPQYNMYNNPLFMISLDTIQGYNFGTIKAKTPLQDIRIKEGTEIDLLSGKISNVSKRVTLLETLNISKEDYINMVNSITSLKYSTTTFNYPPATDFIYAEIPNIYNVKTINYITTEFPSHNVEIRRFYDANKYDDSKNALHFVVKEDTITLWVVRNGLFGYNTTIDEFKSYFLTLVEDGSECEAYIPLDEEIYVTNLNLNNTIGVEYFNGLNFNYNIELIDDRDINIYDTLLKSSNWLDNPSDTGKFKDMGYNYIYNIPVSNVSKDLDIISEVKYSNIEDNIKDNLSKFGLVTTNDKITLYAKEKPTEDIVVRKIKITYR